jgi:hypothetical protein
MKNNLRVERAIKNMTQEEKSDASIPDVGSASPALWVKHVELWIDIMHHFKAQNDMVYVRSIYQMLSSKVVDVLEYEFLYRPDEKATDKVERYQISTGALEKYAECNRLLNPEPVEARQGALPDVNLSTMSTILNTFSSFLYLLLRPRSLFQYFGLYRQPTTTCAAEVKNEVAASVVKRPGVTVL